MLLIGIRPSLRVSRKAGYSISLRARLAESRTGRADSITYVWYASISIHVFHDFSMRQPAAEAFHFKRVHRGRSIIRMPGIRLQWQAVRVVAKGGERAVASAGVSSAKKSLKRRGTVGSAAANPHNARIVRNGSTNLRVIYVLITVYNGAALAHVLRFDFA